MQLFPTRNDMVASLVPKGGMYAEIGVFAGTFSRYLLTVLAPSRLYLLDLFDGNMGSGDQDGNNFSQVNLSTVYNALAADSRFTVLKGDSSTRLSELPDSSLDMVYIDGDHGYEGCMRDLRVAFAKVKADGWIMGHDYEMNMTKARTMYTFGVKQAVDEFCQTFNQTISAKGLDGCVSYAIRLVK